MKPTYTRKEMAVLIWPLLCLSLMICLSCSDRQQCDNHIYDARILCFDLVDMHNNSLIAKWGAKYNSDSTFLVQANGDIAQNSANSSNNICFEFVQHDFEAIDTAVERVYYLYLPDEQGNPKADKDTVNVRYRAFYTPRAICVVSLQVWYNDSLYHDGKFKFHFAFLKK